MGRLTSQRQGSTSSFYGFDSQNSSRILVSLGGLVTDNYSYKAFGEELAAGSGTTNAYRYVGSYGYYRDVANRLYVRARYLAVTNGRWISRDPIIDLRYFSAYMYGYNNPVVIFDPSGLDPALGGSCGPTPGCEACTTITVVCLPIDQVHHQCDDDPTASACLFSNCTMYIDNATCKAMGYDNPKLPPPTPKDCIKKAKNGNPSNGRAAINDCIALHECTHAADCTWRTKRCQSEAKAYAAELECECAYYNKYCPPTPGDGHGWFLPSCNTLGDEIKRTIAKQKFIACVLMSGASCQACIDDCILHSGVGEDVCRNMGLYCNNQDPSKRECKTNP